MREEGRSVSAYWDHAPVLTAAGFPGRALADARFCLFIRFYSVLLSSVLCASFVIIDAKRDHINVYYCLLGRLFTGGDPGHPR